MRGSGVPGVLGVVLGLLLAAQSLFAADWRQDLSPTQPGKFPPPRASSGTYAFGWSALSAAEGTFEFSKTKAGQMRLDVLVKTTGTVRGLYRLDAEHHALARASTFQPLSVRQSEVYSGETIRTDLDFDGKGVVRSRKSSIESPGNGKPKRFDFSPIFDFQGTFLWIRSQTLAPGASYRLVLYPSTDPFLAEIIVVKRETIQIGSRKHAAIRVDLKLRRLNKKLELQPYKSLKRASAWISDDADRLFLKAEADVSVGKVWVELRSIEFKPR